MDKTKKTGALLIGVRFFESEAPSEDTREVPVLIIKEGMGNKADRHLYSSDLLKKAAPLFNGVKAYANHPSKTEETDRPERDIRDIVGWYHSPQVVMVEGKTAIRAMLKINDGAAYDWAWNLVKEAVAFSKKFKDKDLVGISINAWGSSHAVEGEDGKVVNMVDDLTEVQSADIVTQAGAGGGFRLRESVKKALFKEADMDHKALLAKFGEGLKAFHGELAKNPDHAKAYGPAMEALMGAHAELSKSAEAMPPAAGAAGGAGNAEPEVTEAERAANETMEKMREDYIAGKLTPREKSLFEKLSEAETEKKVRANAEMIEKHISEAKLPETYAEDIRILCAGKPEADVKRMVEARKKLVEAIHGGNRAQGAGSGAGGTGGGKPSKLSEAVAKSGVPLKTAAAK